jgi:hypothetical protein
MNNITPFTRAELHEIYIQDVQLRKYTVIKQVFEKLCELVFAKAKEGIFSWSYPLEDCITINCIGIRCMDILKDNPEAYSYPRKRDVYVFQDDILERMKLKFPDCEMAIEDKMFVFNAS